MRNDRYYKGSCSREVRVVGPRAERRSGLKASTLNNLSPKSSRSNHMEAQKYLTDLDNCSQWAQSSQNCKAPKGLHPSKTEPAPDQCTKNYTHLGPVWPTLQQSSNLKKPQAKSRNMVQSLQVSSKPWKPQVVRLLSCFFMKSQAT